MSDVPAILVTGGAGYIGAHACKALAQIGLLPVCYDNLATGHREFVRWGPFVHGDVCDQTRVADTLQQYNVAAVIHLASFSLVGESVADPQKYYLNNLMGTLALLAGMREAGCRRLVLSSTGAVYGDTPHGPVTEAQECRPVNPYGACKWMIERVLADYGSAYGLVSFRLRYFNACGADRSAEIGEWRDRETHLIPRAMMAIQGHLSDFAVYGYDYPTPDGTAIRDYIHVSDLAAAHVSALRLLLDGSDGATLNLGTGAGFSVRQVLSAIAAETGRQVPLTVRPRRPGDPAELVADVSRAREVLGLSLVHSDLRTIVRSAWAWHQKAHPTRN